MIFGEKFISAKIFFGENGNYPLNHFSFPYTLISHRGRYMSHVISMHRPSDPRETAVSDLSKVILFLVGPRLEHSTLVVRVKQHKHTAIATELFRLFGFSIPNLFIGHLIIYSWHMLSKQFRNPIALNLTRKYIFSKGCLRRRWFRICCQLNIIQTYL
jgi:hypothetical protein